MAKIDLEMRAKTFALMQGKSPAEIAKIRQLALRAGLERDGLLQPSNAQQILEDMYTNMHSFPGEATAAGAPTRIVGPEAPDEANYAPAEVGNFNSFLQPVGIGALSGMVDTYAPSASRPQRVAQAPAPQAPVVQEAAPQPLPSMAVPGAAPSMELGQGGAQAAPAPTNLAERSLLNEAVTNAANSNVNAMGLPLAVAGFKMAASQRPGVAGIAEGALGGIDSFLALKQAERQQQAQAVEMAARQEALLLDKEKLGVSRGELAARQDASKATIEQAGLDRKLKERELDQRAAIEREKLKLDSAKSAAESRRADALIDYYGSTESLRTYRGLIKDGMTEEQAYETTFNQKKNQSPEDKARALLVKGALKLAEQTDATGEPLYTSEQIDIILRKQARLLGLPDEVLPPPIVNKLKLGDGKTPTEQIGLGRRIVE